MRKQLLLVVCGLLSLTAAHAQPLLKTHVETGDVEGILDNGVAVYKAIPYAALSGHRSLSVVMCRTT